MSMGLFICSPIVLTVGGVDLDVATSSSQSGLQVEGKDSNSHAKPSNKTCPAYKKYRNKDRAEIEDMAT